MPGEKPRFQRAKLAGFESSKALREEGLAQAKKNEIAHLRKDVHYGQYLQVPRVSAMLCRKERRSAEDRWIAAIIVLAIIRSILFPLDLDVQLALRSAKQRIRAVHQRQL